MSVLHWVGLIPAAFSLVPASDAPDYVNYPAIEQVVCDEGKGTGFRAGGRFVSATHVTSNTNCRIGILEVHNTDEDGMDFSTGPSAQYGYRVDCSGFREGQTYWAIGFADGLPFQRRITLIGWGKYAGNGMAILVGRPTVIPGMSGGPIFNERNEVVGTINMFSPIFPVSLSQEMRGTSLCE